MDRSRYLRAGDTGQAVLKSSSLSQLPGFVVDAAAASQASDPRHLMALQNASRQGAPPSAPGRAADPGALVARALAILTQEAENRQAREGGKLAPRSVR
jgi:hypothetical protein